MKNVNVYIGTIKRCLDLNKYNEYGDVRKQVLERERTGTTETITYAIINYTEIIDDQAIIIETKPHTYYHFKLDNTIKDNLHIISQNEYYTIPTKPDIYEDTFVEESTLVPYYEEQPKSLSLTKLKKDILMYSKINTEIGK